MAIFTIVFNIVQGNFVAPIVYSQVVSLHPAVVLVAIPAGNQIAGVIGMFLVVPFLGVVAAVWRTVLRVLGHRACRAAACRGSRGRGAGSRVVDGAQRLSAGPARDFGRTARPDRTRTRNGAGRTRRSEPGPAPSRVDQMVRDQIPSALALAAGELLVREDPCAWSSASFWIWAVVGSSAGAAAGAGAYACGGGAAASAACCCSAASLAGTSVADGG